MIRYNIPITSLSNRDGMENGERGAGVVVTGIGPGVYVGLQTQIIVVSRSCWSLDTFIDNIDFVRHLGD